MFSIILSACVLAAVTMWVYAARIRRAAVRLDEVARPAANRRLAHRADAAPHDLVADPTPCSRNFDMGHVLTLARLSDRHRNRILLFRGYIHDPWLRRCVAGQVMATARTSRRLNGRPHVRFVHRLLLRQRESNLSIAVGEIHRYFCFRRIGVRRGPTGAPASRIKNS